MFQEMDEHQRFVLRRSIIDNFPGFKGVTLEDVRAMLSKYENFSAERLRENLAAFLTEVVPVAEEWGCRLVIHPDDPPRSILGLPRIFSNMDDIKSLLAISSSPANSICFCAGSFSAREDNNVVEMFKSCADHVGFLHLRSTQVLPNGDFYEAPHLEGRVDMYELVTPQELSRIVTRSATILGMPIEEAGAMEIASRSRGTPRIANRFLRRVRDFAQIMGDGTITKEAADLALQRLEVDGLGLDAIDRRMLTAIIKNYGGGPVGLETLAATIGEEAVTLEDVYEPYLMQLGFLTRTPRGRCVTQLAYDHLHIPFDGQTHFDI